MASRPVQKKAGPKIICHNKDCLKMGKHQNATNFYKTRNPMMPYHPFCKECVENGIDYTNMETVYDTLRVLDVPFIMDLWADIAEENNSKKNIFGKYLAAVNIRRDKKLRFSDSEYEFSEEWKQNRRAREQAELDEMEAVREQKADEIANVIALDAVAKNNIVWQEEAHWDDDWRGEYTDRDLKYLNNYYEGLNRDFKIDTINYRDYARKIAKASLAMDKAYQDVLDNKDGAEVAYEKATRNFDTLSKSAQFTANQRTANDVTLGCFGRVFDLVEKHNWVPDYVPTDEDMYDKLLKQFANIERSLK